VRKYIRNQEEHHRSSSLGEEIEDLFPDRKNPGLKPGETDGKYHKMNRG
jgi:hypothetical protein